MKRYLFFVFCVTFSLLAFAKGEKVIDKSAHQTPDWVYGMENGFVITSAEASTMETARSLAMQQVKERIVSAVAEHVESESSVSNSETVTESDIQSLSVFAKQIKTKSADIPYLNNVSEAHVSDYYWEKIKKSDGKISYVYHVKYPFSDLEIRKIIKEWQQQHKLSSMQALDFDEKLEQYAAIKFSSLSSVEQMIEKMNEVLQMQSQLPDLETRRKDACSAVTEGYKRQLAEIQIRAISITREYIEYALYYGSNKVSYQAKPKMQSNCLSQMVFEPIASGARVSYDFQTGCYDDETNYIEISYSICGKKISNKFFVK